MTVHSPAQVIDMLTATQAARANANTEPPASTSSGSGSKTITSADFMTLLVTEMKNQDPTQPTDPTQYVQQLVGVNSLEQLIDINKELSGVTASS